MWTREQKRDYQRKWRERNRDKVREAHRAWVRANPEKMLAAKRRYRQQHPDLIRAYNAAYNAAHRDEMNAASLRWRQKNRERLRAYYRAYELKRRHGKVPLVAMGEALETALGRNTLYAATKAAVPQGLPRDVRDDVMQSIILAVLEGELEEAEIAGAAKRFIAKHYAGRPWGSVSLDDYLPGTTLRYIDTLAAAE